MDAEAGARLREISRALKNPAGASPAGGVDALDLSQEAFARAYQATHRLDPDRPFYAWLGQIVRRLCLNFLRDSRTHARLLDTEDASRDR